MNNPIIKISKKMSGKMSGKILSNIQENKQITIPELALKIKVTERTIERPIQTLQKANELKRIGGRKAGHWEIIKFNT